MTNLVIDPTFTTGATNWKRNSGYDTPPAFSGGFDTDYGNTVVDGVAHLTGDGYGGMIPDILGNLSPVPAGTAIDVSVDVAHPSKPVKVALYQGATVLASAAQTAATGTTLATVTFQATTTGTDELHLRVWIEDDYSADALLLAAPTAVVYVAPVDPTDPTDPVEPTEPVAVLVAALAPRVAAYTGLPTSDTATAALPVVIEFVKGYTRDAGFGADGYTPSASLASVLVSVAARVATNPEQVAYFQAGEYAERPAVLNGFTLAELAVLNRYRRRAW